MVGDAGIIPAALLPARLALGALTALHLALVGLLFAATLMQALGLFWLRRRLAGLDRLLQLALPRRDFTLLLWLSLPAIVALSHHLYQPAFSWKWWLPALVLLGSALLLAGLLRQRLLSGAVSAQAVSGALASAGLLSVAVLCTLCGLSLLMFPGKWLVLPALPQIFLSWNAIFVLAQFLCLSLALAGGLLLSGRTDSDEEELIGTRLGTVLCALFLLALPIPLMLELLFVPLPALGTAVFAGFAALAALAAAGVLLLCGWWWRGHPGGLRRVLLITLFALFGALAFKGETLRATALQEHLLASSVGLELPPLVMAPQLGAKSKPAVSAEPELSALLEAGRKVFERSCRACHDFERRLMGPPLNAVLPKYRGESGKLQAFIDTPHKVDADYPPMPRLGLPAADIEAVSAYLLHHLEEVRP